MKNEKFILSENEKIIKISQLTQAIDMLNKNNCNN